jgi:hypothetical protein
VVAIKVNGRASISNLHSDGGNLVLVVLLVHEVNVAAGSLGLGLALAVFANVRLDACADCKLGGTLANLGEVGTGEAGGALGKEVEVDAGVDGGLAEGRLENGQTRSLVGEGNVDELIKTTRAEQSGVDLVGTVCCQ